MFETCKRWWFYSKVLRIPAVQDLTYAHAGTAIHNTLEKFYKGEIKAIPHLRAHFDMEWARNNLGNSKISLKKEQYWLMVVEGINKDIKPTDLEMCLSFPEVIAYLDVVDTKNHIIADWKSSTRSPLNEVSYKKQIMLYAWLYYKKYHTIPTKVIVYYLKYNGSNGELSFVPNNSDMLAADKWFYDLYKEMLDVTVGGKVPDKCETCSPWCPYGDRCEQEGRLDYKIVINNDILKIEGKMTNVLSEHIDKSFSYELKNAFFIKKTRPMANTTVRFWNLRLRLLPIGFLHRIHKILEDYIKFKKLDGNITIVDNRTFLDKTIELPDKLNGITMRDYQEEAVKIALDKKIGCLQCCTGSGKSSIAAEITRKLAYRTLFIVDKIELLNQMKNNYKKLLGIDVGVIGGGEDKLGHITVATIQSLVKNKEKYANYLNTVRVLFIDEGHHASSQSYIQLSKYLKNTEYRLMLTGTYKREDGNEMKMWAVGGNIIYNMPADKLIERGFLEKPIIKFLEYNAIKYLDTAFESEDKYAEYYKKGIVNNPIRNSLIVDIVKKNPDKKTLILVKLIEHGDLLEMMIPNSKYLHGSTKKSERKEIFDEFINGDRNILISTINIAAEGLDIPALNVVINAAGNKSDIKTIQVLGRVIRKLKGKTAQYIDFNDRFKFLDKASYGRILALRREGHDVIEVGQDVE